MSDHYTTTSTTLAPGAPVQIVPLRRDRATLFLQNTGTNALTIGFGEAPVAGKGMTLDPASAANGQGGAFYVDQRAPIDAVFAVSTAGTSIVVIEGTFANNVNTMNGPS